MAHAYGNYLWNMNQLPLSVISVTFFYIEHMITYPANNLLVRLSILDISPRRPAPPNEVESKVSIVHDVVRRALFSHHA